MLRKSLENTLSILEGSVNAAKNAYAKAKWEGDIIRQAKYEGYYQGLQDAILFLNIDIAEAKREEEGI